MELTPSHVAFTAILLELVHSGRKAPSSVQFFSVTGPLCVLCFLGDRVSLQHCHQYASVHELLDELVSYFHGSEETFRNGQEFRAKVTDVLTKLYTIDDMIDFADTVDTIFEVDATVSPNEVMAPIRICTDSSLGIFARAFIAKWNCLKPSTIRRLRNWVGFQIPIQTGWLALSRIWSNM